MADRGIGDTGGFRNTVIHTTNGHGSDLNLNGGGRSFHLATGSPMTAGAMALMNSHETAELLGALNERSKSVQETIKSVETKIDKHDERLQRVENALDSLGPIKTIFWKGIGAILMAILVAVMALVITRNNAVTDIIDKMPPTQQTK